MGGCASPVCWTEIPKQIKGHGVKPNERLQALVFREKMICKQRCGVQCKVSAVPWSIVNTMVTNAQLYSWDTKRSGVCGASNLRKE